MTGSPVVIYLYLNLHALSRPCFSLVVACSKPLEQSRPVLDHSLLGLKHQRNEKDGVTKVRGMYLHKPSATTTRPKQVCSYLPESEETPTTVSATLDLFRAPHLGHLLSSDLCAYKLLSTNCAYRRHAKIDFLLQ